MGKNSSTDLFQLIKSLSSEEKVYFKKYTSGYGSDVQLYHTVFDMIDKQKEYDENKIINKILQQKIKRRAFFDSKMYLLRMILSSLGAFNKKSNIGFQIIEIIQFSESLFDKGLYRLSLKKIKKAKILSDRFEYFQLLLNSLEIERKIMRVMLDIQSYENFIINHFKEVQHIQQTYDNFVNYERLAAVMSILIRKRGLARSNKEKKETRIIFKNALLKSESKALSFNAKVHFYRINTVYYHHNIDKYASYPYSLGLVQLFDSNPHQIEDKQIAYVTALRNVLASQSDPQLIYIDSFWVTLEKLKKLIPRSEHINIQKWEIILMYEPIGYNMVGEFEKGVKIIDELLPYYYKYFDSIAEEVKVTFYINIIHLHFGIKNYSHALKWMNELLNMHSTDSRVDMFYFGKLMNVLIHIELGNKEILKSIIDSLQRYTNKQDRMYKSESIVYKNLKKIIALEKKSDLAIAYKHFHAELSGLLKKSDEKKYTTYIDIIAWIESKITGKTFAEVVKAKVQSQKENLEKKHIQHK